MINAHSTVTVNPSALSGVRFLVSRRIDELDSGAAKLEAGIAEAAERREELRTQIEEAERRWTSTMDNLKDRHADEIDASFRQLASLRADLAGVDERQRSVSVRLQDARKEQEVLRSVYRSLDDLAASTEASGSGPARLRSTSRQVFQIIEEERMRIARDMHDGPAQAMANLVLQAEILERMILRDPERVVGELVSFKEGVRAVLDDTRRLIFDLRPMTLDDLGLVPTLRKFVKEFGDESGFQARLSVMGEEGRLPGAIEPTLFRIIQEALNNVKKHAQAHSVEVIISMAPNRVSAIIRDDGVGFDVAATEARIDATKHLGMVSMRERADLEKGRLEIRSQVGKGTEVRAIFELDQQEDRPRPDSSQ